MDGADYLRKLKVGEQAAGLAPTSQSLVVAAPPANEKPVVREKRASPRYACRGSARFRQLDSEVQSWGTFTDVSLHGCYVEVTATFPVGTRLSLSLELNGQRVSMMGEVRVSYPFLGIGIAFREMSEENRQRLAEMMRAVALAIRVAASERERSATDSKPGGNESRDTPDPRRALEALVEFFDQRSLLSREEFYRLLRDSQLHPQTTPR